MITPPVVVLRRIQRAIGRGTLALVGTIRIRVTPESIHSKIHVKPSALPKAGLQQVVK